MQMMGCVFCFWFFVFFVFFAEKNSARRNLKKLSPHDDPFCFDNTKKHLVTLPLVGGLESGGLHLRCCQC